MFSQVIAIKENEEFVNTFTLTMYCFNDYYVSVQEILEKFTFENAPEDSITLEHIQHFVSEAIKDKSIDHTEGFYIDFDSGLWYLPLFTAGLLLSTYKLFGLADL